MTRTSDQVNRYHTQSVELKVVYLFIHLFFKITVSHLFTGSFDLHVSCSMASMSLGLSSVLDTLVAAEIITWLIRRAASSSSPAIVVGFAGRREGTALIQQYYHEDSTVRNEFCPTVGRPTLFTD